MKAAQASRIADADAWLAKRYTVREVAKFQAIHLDEEQRPIETLWDAQVAVTAYARGLEHQDARVKWEREGGKILDLVAV